MSTDYPKDIFAGEQGFLYYSWHSVLEQLCQASLPTERGLKKWKFLFEARRAWCERRNIRYLTLVIPERHVIYEDQLPENIKISPNRASVRLQKALEDFSPDLFLYPEAELKQARETADVFFKTDEHLNPYGSYICYKYLLDHLADMGLTPRSAEDYSIETFLYTGNLGIHLDSEPSEQAEDWTLKNKNPPLEINTISKKQRKYLEVFRHEDKTLPKALFFGDSNVECLKKFLTPHFSKFVNIPFIHQIFYDLASHEKPDLIVHIMAEYQLGINFLNPGDQPAYPVYGDIERYDFEEYFDMSIEVYKKTVVTELAFDPESQSQLHLLSGWGELENNAIWMLDSISRIALDLCAIPTGSRSLYIEIKQSPFLHLPTIRQQRIRLYCEMGAKTLNLNEHIIHEDGIILWKIDLAALQEDSEDTLILTFEHPDGVAPFTLKDRGPDLRVLSFCVSRITIYAD